LTSISKNNTPKNQVGKREKNKITLLERKPCVLCLMSFSEALKERKANIERRGRGSKIGKPSTKIIALDEIL
jgi:23S rRNA maturation mini-RNase III